MNAKIKIKKLKIFSDELTKLYELKYLDALINIKILLKNSNKN